MSTDRKPTKAQAALLAAVADGHVTYSQYTGGFGARYEDTRTGRTIARTRIDPLAYGQVARWVKPPTLAQKIGYGFTMTLALTDEGRAALAQVTS